MATSVTADTVIKLIGLGLTIMALVFTAFQIQASSKTLIFTTEQGLYKESRDVLRYIADHPAMVAAARLEDDSSLDPKARVELALQIGVLLNFYNSILSKRYQPYVSAEFRHDFIKDFCDIVNYPQVKKRGIHLTSRSMGWMRSGGVAAVHKLVVGLALCLAVPTAAAHAEFIGNVLSGTAEQPTRDAASRAFQGFQAFYAGMAQLEQRNAGGARENFLMAVGRFREAQSAYEAAAPLIGGRGFVLSRLDPQQQQALAQFLAPFGASPTSKSDEILRAYAHSFAETAALIDNGPISLARFRQIQISINRQILVGTLITTGLAPT